MRGLDTKVGLGEDLNTEVEDWCSSSLQLQGDCKSNFPSLKFSSAGVPIFCPWGWSSSLPTESCQLSPGIKLPFTFFPLHFFSQSGFIIALKPYQVLAFKLFKLLHNAIIAFKLWQLFNLTHHCNRCSNKREFSLKWNISFLYPNSNFCSSVMQLNIGREGPLFIFAVETNG